MAKPETQNPNLHSSSKWKAQGTHSQASLSKKAARFWAANTDQESAHSPGMSSIIDATTLNHGFVLTRLEDLAGWGEVLLDIHPVVRNERNPSNTQFEICLTSLAAR